jgi:hypothetical protein
MKNFVFVAFAMLPFFAHAQFNQWFPGHAMTDSTHQNRNAFLLGQYYENILFWDQELDATTTQLCYKNVDPSSIGNQQIALSQAGVKLSNPVAIVLGNGIIPSEYLLIYQTNEGNDIDLKCITYQPNGTFTAPVTVSALPGDDIRLTTDGYGKLAWENSGKIWISQYLYQSNLFTTPYAVDSAGAYTPVYAPGGLSYLKPNGDSTFLISVYPDYSQNNWTIYPINSQSILGQSSALANAGPLSGGNMCMQNKVGSNPTGLVLTDGWNNELIHLNSPNFNYSQPAIDEMTLITKSNYFFPTILAFVSDSLTQKDIFAEAPSYYGLQNISLWPGEDTNPKFFVTFPTGYSVAVNLFWESDREGFSTIYSTHYDYLFGGITETQKEQTLLAKPCPFTRETSILFHAAGTVNLKIWDLQGRNVKTLSAEKDADGWCKALWDGTNDSGNSVSPGSYIVVAISGKTTQSLIIIKN